jgi:toxin ParE1/3/4
MPSPERQRKLVLAPRARQDFIDILRQTAETWGQGQLHICRDRINDALQLIARNPALGERSPDLPDTHRLWLVGPHVIVYREHDSTLAVVRVLPQRMIPDRQDRPVVAAQPA